MTLTFFEKEYQKHVPGLPQAVAEGRISPFLLHLDRIVRHSQSLCHFFHLHPVQGQADDFLLLPRQFPQGFP